MFKMADLFGEVVVEVRDDLHSHVSLASPRRSHHQCEARMHATPNGLHLSGGEWNSVPAEMVGDHIHMHIQYTVALVVSYI